MLPDHEGRFRASIGDHGVSRTGPNKLLTFVCDFRLTEELSGEDWVPVDQGYEITGYFYLVKRDGNLNSITIDSLEEAFGWDGRDPMWLQDTDFASHQVQLKLEWETYEGKTRIKIKYLNKFDATPSGIPHAGDEERQVIASTYGSKFRAQAGGSPIAAPKPVATRPPKLAAPSMGPKGGTKEDAWAALLASKPGASPEDCETAWFEAIARLFPNRDQDSLTAAEWLELATKMPELVIPF